MVSAWRAVLLAAASHIVDLQICLLDCFGRGLQQTLRFFWYLVVLQNHIGHVHNCDFALDHFCLFQLKQLDGFRKGRKVSLLPFCCRKSREDEEKEERYCACFPPHSGCSRTGDWEAQMGFLHFDPCMLSTIQFDLSYEESLRIQQLRNYSIYIFYIFSYLSQ